MTAVQNSPSSYKRDEHKTLKHAAIATGVGGAIGAGTFHFAQSIIINNESARDTYLKQAEEQKLEEKLAKKPGFFNIHKDLHEAIKDKKINGALTAKAAGILAAEFLVLYGIIHLIKSAMKPKDEE